MKHSGSTNVLTVAELATAVNNLSSACLLSGRVNLRKVHKKCQLLLYVTDKYGILMSCCSLRYCQNLSSYYESTEASLQVMLLFVVLLSASVTESRFY